MNCNTLTRQCKYLSFAIIVECLPPLSGMISLQKDIKVACLVVAGAIPALGDYSATATKAAFISF